MIEPRFGMTPILAITADDSERFHIDIHPAHPPNKKRAPEGKLKLSWNKAHRTLKVWRSLLNKMVKYELRPVAPIGDVANPQPIGRTGLWEHEEVLQLTWAAVLLGHYGMAAAIRIGWCCGLSPVDVWSLNRGDWRQGASGTDVVTRRKKTQKPVYHAVDKETLAFVDSYIESLPVKIAPNQRLIRRKDWTTFRDKDAFGDTFREIRELAFSGDNRAFSDLRRSVATEAFIGGATRDDIGDSLANTVERSAFLQATYLHGASQRVLETRQEGRKKMRGRKNG